MDVAVPLGFRALTANVGIRDETPDLLVVACDEPGTTAGVFTRSRFAGPSVELSRAAVADGRLRGIVVVAKNANVANGPLGLEHAIELQALAAGLIGCAPGEVAVASTGVIGRPYPMPVVREFFDRGQVLGDFDPSAAATAMMTTDTHPKVASARIGNAGLVGIAKGVGMIEPDMATLLTFFFTDALVEASELDALFRRVMDRTFNCVSIDTDTSTSDTAVVLASGLAGPVEAADFEAALLQVATTLTKMVAADGEGATKLIEVTVSEARDHGQAKRVAKSIVNSPLVKTAVFGADPNWGRVAMAIGKCSEDLDISPGTTTIAFGDLEVYPGASDLEALTAYMKGQEIEIRVALRTGSATATVWGCDLSPGYVAINADYST